jgi:hypothetical protein
MNKFSLGSKVYSPRKIQSLGFRSWPGFSSLKLARAQGGQIETDKLSPKLLGKRINLG